MQKARNPCEMASLVVAVTACVLYIISVSYGQIDYLASCNYIIEQPQYSLVHGMDALVQCLAGDAHAPRYINA